MTATKTKKKSDLTAPESKRLEQCESIIRVGKQTFMEVGTALYEIRESKLYRASHKTFEAYTEETWGWGASRARQIINAVQIQKSVTRVTLLDSQAARELGKVPAAKRQEVAEKAAINGHASAPKIKEVAAETMEAPKKLPKAPGRPSKAPATPEKPKDESGRVIDPKAADAIARIGEFQALEKSVHEVKRKVLALAAEDIGRCLDGQAMGRLFKEICAAIDFARPFTACPMNERCTKSCGCCKGSQWITESVWKNVPPEFKKVRPAK